MGDMINGLTASTNGAMNGQKDDISKLINTLLSIENSVSLINNSILKKDAKEMAKSSMSVNKTPTVEDLIRFTNNLGVAVPTGFILIHNDLEKLIGSNGGSGANWTTALALALGTVIANAIPSIVTSLGQAGSQVLTAGGEAVSGVVDSVSGGTVNIINALKTNKNIDFILENETLNSQIANDEDVKNLRLAYTKYYLKSYYLNLINSFGYAVNDETGDLYRDASLSSVLTDFTDAIASMAGSAASSLMDAITNTQENAKISSSDSVQRARIAGYSNYLKAYYANMLQPFGYRPKDINKDPWELEQSGGDFTTVLNDFAQAIGSMAEELVGSVTRAVANNASEVALNFDSNILAVRRLGYSNYLKAYYANMIDPMGYQVADINAPTWTLVKQASAQSVIKVFTDSLAGLIAAPIEAIGQSLTNVMADGVMNTDEGVTKTRQEGYRAYVRAYYINMLESFGYTVDIDNLNKDNFTIRKGGFGEGLLKSLINDATSTIGRSFGNLIGGTLSSIGEHIYDTSLDSDSSIKATKVSGYNSLLKIYYEKMADAIDDVNGNWGSDLRSYAKDSLKKAFDSMGDNFSKQMESTTQVIQSSFDDTKIRVTITNLSTIVSAIRDKLDSMEISQPVIVNNTNSNSSSPINIATEIPE